MFCAFMLMAVKLGQAIESGESLFDKLFIGSVAAQDEPKAATPDAAPKTEQTPTPSEKPAESAAESKPEEAKLEDKKADAPAVDATKENKKEGGDTKPAEAEASSKEEDDTFLTPIFSGSKKEYKPEDLIGNQLGGTRPDDRRFSPVELQLLQQLSDRRIKLDEREKSVELKENLLAQTEVRVNEKFNEMTNLRSELGELIRRYNEIEDTKVRSLVKIYENMKPKDAARIFDEVEMPILLMVIDQMSEKKAAPILANMDSNKAKEITVQLAEQRRLQDDEIASKRAAAAAAAAEKKPAATTTPPATPPATNNP
jgi:flagellar motility protein MotE (MotC chaperone)